MIALCCMLAPAVSGRMAFARDNGDPDSIIGTYSVTHKGEVSKVRISGNGDGTYDAQVFWVKNRLDAGGRVRKDGKNPDKRLRDVDCDRIFLFKGLRYNRKERCWDGTKIYDPVRGINADVRVVWKDSGTLLLKGTKLGVSETVCWTKLP